MHPKSALIHLIFFLSVSLLLAFAGCSKRYVSPEEAIAANKELDRRYNEACKAKDLDAIMACWWKSAEAAYFPSDNINGHHGWDAIKASMKLMLDGTDKIVSAEVIDVKYVVLGEAVVGTGKFALSILPKGSPKQVDLVTHFTDIREMKDGKWVYVYGHESMNPMLGPDMVMRQ